MADNTGLYVNYDELIQEIHFSGSSEVVASAVTLSNKTVDPGGDIYDFVVSGSDPAPVVGDVVSQLGNSDEVIAILSGPDRIQINKTGAENLIVNGTAKTLHAENIPKARGEGLIQDAMDFIDEETGQFFNKRSGVWKIEGNNTKTLFFSVPIIEITKLVINSTNTELIEGEDDDFIAFKGRTAPRDDRRNPMIKLNIGRARDSIFTRNLTNRIFLRNTLTEITGSFGFLEGDGSTPRLIKKAVIMLAGKSLGNPTGSISSNVGTGPIKRREVDLHEIEFFEHKLTTSRAAISSIPEVDRIIAKYKRTIRVGGSFKHLPLTVDGSEVSW